MSTTYKGTKTNEISFPLGGIGSGCIGLAGNGRLIEWEIFNRPNKRSLNGLSHFAVRAEKDGKVLDARILQGDLNSPYNGDTVESIGYGPDRKNMCGMPHFREHSFKGEYPFAELEFGGEETFPGKVKLESWSVFIPNKSLESSLPAAFFEIEFENTTQEQIDYTAIGALSNPFGIDNTVCELNEKDDVKALTMFNSSVSKEDFEYGDISIAATGDDLSYQQYWYRGEGFASLEVYWYDMLAGGKFKNRVYEGGGQYRSWDRIETGHLASHVTVAPGEKRKLVFVITWNVPNNYNYWQAENKDYLERIKKNGLENRWKNFYATVWKDSFDSAQYAMDNYEDLRMQTASFHDALFNSSLPEVALEAVSANLSTLKTPTCLRLEDGTFYGWEGCNYRTGSCEGSCTHVWNYAQALPFLFPDLERSMRSANYNYSIDEYGGSHFRLHLPLGVKAVPEDFRPCADGQFGDVIKAYRDWKISGNSKWLENHWEAIKKTIQYAWTENNPDKWDINKTGVLYGRQHHTLDLELFGPNAWLTGYYLAALKAASEMAEFFGEEDFAAECSELFKKGKAWADENLFNGEYFCQKIDLNDKSIVDEFDADNYWSEEHSQIKYQVDQGVEIDMPIAQWHSNLYGLGEIYNYEKVVSTLAAIHKYSYKETMRNEYNPWRIYAINDEPGTRICTWPENTEQPAIPLPYSPEDQGGYTYAAAIQMIQCGLIEEGLCSIRAIRERYDGEKRNPWNEFECGSNYARSMASYSLLNTYSKMRFDMVNGFIGFEPLEGDFDNFKCFWSLDGAWGEIIYSNDSVELLIHAGSLDLNSIDFAVNCKDVETDKESIPFSTDGTRIKFAEKINVKRLLVTKS